MTVPHVSIITVCRNALSSLLRTEFSIRAQTCNSIEWIIVDGDSRDGTREHLESITDSWILWKSERDNGIYDAMNKGIQMATGRWLWFLNAGDVFHLMDTVKEIQKAPPDAEICYGDVMIEEPAGHKIGLKSEITPHKLPVELDKYCFRNGMVVSHQAFVVRREVAPLFNSEDYRFSGDLDWMLNVLATSRKSCRLGVLARMPREGATRNNWRRSQWERLRILQKHFGTISCLVSHVYIVFRRIPYILRNRRLR
jgi:glycosyltransferase involved in cell wall biosynthesis